VDMSALATGSVKQSFDVEDAGMGPTPTSTLLATYSGLDWPFKSRKRPEKKPAVCAAGDVTLAGWPFSQID